MTELPTARKIFKILLLKTLRFATQKETLKRFLTGFAIDKLKLPEYFENCFSSIPLRYYNQGHCERMRIMKKFRKMYKCRILPLYGTWDLVENETLPICRREMIMKMMPTMRMMAQMESFKNGEFEGIEKKINAF